MCVRVAVMPKKLVVTDHQIGYKKKGELVSVLANFGLRLEKQVVYSEDLPGNFPPSYYKGFLVRVTHKGRRRHGQRRAVAGTCFLPWYRVNNSNQLVTILGEALPTVNLMCELTPAQIKTLLLTLAEEFYDASSDSDSENPDESSSSVLPVTCVGRQPNSDVYIIGPGLQFLADGTPIPPEEQRYVWISSILQDLKVRHSIFRSLPEVQYPLRKIVEGLQHLLGDNLISGLLLLGASTLSLFYESMMKRVGSVAISIAYGVISAGKTNAAKVALAMCCGFPKRYASSLTDSVARSMLKEALPFVFDDPSNTALIKPILMNSFGGSEIGTSREQFAARCSPLITANTEVLDELAEDVERYMYRAVLVPFPFAAPSVTMDTLDKILCEAPAAFPHALAVGEKVVLLDEKYFYKMRSMVEREIPGIEQRIAMQYATSLVTTQMLATEASHPGFGPEEVWEYFKANIAPQVQQYQVRSSATQQTLGNLALQYVLKETYLSVVLQSINPNVKYKVAVDQRRKHHEGSKETVQVKGVAICLKEFLQAMANLGMTHPGESFIRKQLRKRRTAATGKKQWVLAKGSKREEIPKDRRECVCVACVCIPAADISEEFFSRLKEMHSQSPDDSGIVRDIPFDDEISKNDYYLAWGESILQEIEEEKRQPLMEVDERLLTELPEGITQAIEDMEETISCSTGNDYMECEVDTIIVVDDNSCQSGNILKKEQRRQERKRIAKLPGHWKSHIFLHLSPTQKRRALLFGSPWKYIREPHMHASQTKRTRKRLQFPTITKKTRGHQHFLRQLFVQQKTTFGHVHASGESEEVHCYTCGDLWVEGKTPPEKWIGCDECHKWQHYHCAKIKRKPRKYFCPACKMFN